MTKDFDISDILSITTERLVSTRHVEGVYDILNFMTGENLMTHALPRASRICAPALLKQHPKLRKVDVKGVNPKTWKTWLAVQRKKFGDTLPVKTLPPGAYEAMHPLDEPILKGKDVIVVKI